MAVGSDSEHVMWRVLAIREGGAQFLVIENGRNLALPSVAVHRGTRTVPDLNTQLRAAWGLDVFSLCPLAMELSSNGRSSQRVQIVEAINDAQRGRTRWLRTAVATETHFLELSDVPVVEQWRDEMIHGSQTQRSTPLGLPGSQDTLRAWMNEALQPFGLTVGTQFLQLSADKAFALVRFETNSHPIWFKAVGEGNTREFALTLLLAESFPAFLPKLLATKPAWNAWIAAEVPGLQLAEHQNSEAWIGAARDLATLQIASVPLAERILQCGAQDARVPALCTKVGPFFEMLRDLMTRQVNASPAPLSSGELDCLESHTWIVLSCFERDRIPASLGHLDLNPGNMIVGSDTTVFLDWAEGCIGHPFVTFAYQLEHFRK